MSFLLRFNPFLGSLWILSHIGKKCAPCMPYKLLGKGMVYHYYTCVVVVQACLALRCWQQNCAGVKPISATRQALGLRWKSLKRTILEMGTASKSAFLWGGFPTWVCVVVVHHAFAQELIRHAWGAFLVDVGQNPKASQKWVKPEEETHVAWEQNRAGLAPQSGQIACVGNLPQECKTIIFLISYYYSLKK